LNWLIKCREVVKRYRLCDACLGRLFGLRGYGLSNRDRGRALKTMLVMDAYRSERGLADEELVRALAETGFEPAIRLLRDKLKVEVKRAPCYLCGGLMDRLNELANRVAAALSEYEFTTFVLGCRLPLDLVVREEKLWTFLGLEDAESIKSEITREVGKMVKEMLGKEYSQESPDVMAIIDLRDGSVEVMSKPLFVYGRYRKLVRGLPQNPWPYKDSDRVLYDTSIEELITPPIVEAAAGAGAKFHAAGREDVDVRTLGTGRPFVVEVKNPKRRSLDLKALERAINERGRGLIEVEGLRLVDRSYVSRIKALAELAKKTYVARVKFSDPVSEERLKALEEEFRGAVIRQRTPLRVLGRRADRVRRKVVYSVKARKIGEDVVEFTITCQGGLYVKELIHGDEGRTQPNFSDFLGVKVEDIELDVVAVEEAS